MDMVRQCLLRDDRGGLTTAWIDADYAVPQRRMTLRMDRGQNSVPVTVVKAWETRRPAAEVRERSHDWTRTRKASDI